ncbi:MAG: LysM peptidoglycan-binding domain-containing protein [Rubrivivax sp.]|nr:LysM peptidoglycan-binding domain-containing protein [Rubrivivax sp.]
MAQHTVKAGDCFASIAKANGYHDYRTLYAHNVNTAIRMLRANPNMLVPGDVVDVPAKRIKRVALKLDGTTVLLIKRCRTHLKLHLTTAGRQPYTVEACSFDAGGKRLATPPAGNGLLELSDIDAAASTGTLEVRLAALPAAPAAAPAVPPPDPPAHPPAIDEAGFTDRSPELDADAVRVRWSLRLGALEPHDTVRGVLQRLHNLGVSTPVVTAENDATERAVKAWQAAQRQDPRSGAVVDVRVGVEALHDHP